MNAAAKPDFAEGVLAAIEQSIPERFCQQAARYGERPALGTPAGEMTYAELNHAANRVAHALLATGGDSGQRLGLLLDDDASMVIGWLGILKSGHVCVPLALSSPPARLSYILEQSEPAALVTNDRHLGLAHQLTAGRLPILNLDTLDPQQSPGTNPDLVIPPASLAYILYTSGTTGRPKGVMQTHRNVLRNVHGLAGGLGITPDDRLAALTSFSMGQGVATKAIALMSGAALFPFDLKQKGIAPLAAWLHEQRITVFTSAVTVFRHFAQSLPPDARFPHLRAIRLGAEASRAGDVRLFQEKFPPGCLLLNSLSCTETTNYAQYRIDHHTLIDGPIVPGGYPVEGMEVLLWDEAGREVGCDCPGEIVVRSRYLALGYWNDPNRTREVFSDEADGRRIYRTGDLALRRPDGRIDYLGRKDFQVKVRGYRVELIEIESCLCRHPEVSSAVVEARRDERDEVFLVAHVEPKTGTFPSTRALREYTRQHLPEYMVPAALVLLETLPLTPSGKPDRAVLAVLLLPREADAPAVFPRSRLEEDLARIWRELLPRSTGGVKDSFFDVGGNSLLAAQLLMRLEKEFSVTVSLHDLFHHPTIETLARRLASGTPETSFTSLVCLNPEGPAPPLFIIHGWGGAVFQFNGFARALRGIRPVFALQAVEFAGQKRHRTYEEMARHYADEITRASPAGPCDVLGYSMGGMIAFAVARELTRRGHQVGRLFIVDSRVRNLPWPEHLRMIGPYLLRRFRRHLKTLLSMPVRSWLGFLQARQQGLHDKLEQGGAPQGDPAVAQIPAGRDHYQMAGTRYVPQPGAFDVRLFVTLHQPYDIVRAWSYLARRRLKAIVLRSPHLEIFSPEHLDEFVAAFRQASAPATERPSR